MHRQRKDEKKRVLAKQPFPINKSDGTFFSVIRAFLSGRSQKAIFDEEVWLQLSCFQGSFWAGESWEIWRFHGSNTQQFPLFSSFCCSSKNCHWPWTRPLRKFREWIPTHRLCNMGATHVLLSPFPNKEIRSKISFSQKRLRFGGQGKRRKKMVSDYDRQDAREFFPTQNESKGGGSGHSKSAEFPSSTFCGKMGGRRQEGWTTQTITLLLSSTREVANANQ